MILTLVSRTSLDVMRLYDNILDGRALGLVIAMIAVVPTMSLMKQSTEMSEDLMVYNEPDWPISDGR